MFLINLFIFSTLEVSNTFISFGDSKVPSPLPNSILSAIILALTVTVITKLDLFPLLSTAS